MRLEDLEQKELRGWTLRDVHYMWLKDHNDDFLIKKGPKELIVVTTSKEHLKQIWASTWPRREVAIGTSKALINKSEVVFLDGKTDSERLFLTTEKNIKEDIGSQNFAYLKESKKPEAEFPE